MSNLREAEVDAAGARSRLIEAGAADADEAVVFVHGNPGSRLDWRDLVGACGEFGRALAFDLPGFGSSRAPRGFDHAPEGYARFMQEALAERGVNRAHFVVHDIGGPLTWPLASDHPEQVASVTMMNTGLLDGRRWHTAARLWRRPVIGEAVMALTTPGRVRSTLASANGGRAVPAPFLKRMAGDYDRHTKRTILRLYRAMDVPYAAAPRWREALARHDPPALIVWGERDPFVPARAIDRLRAAFPSAQVKRLPASGHFPFADDPEGVAGAVLPFLREAQRG